jgi:hypothetical protein
MHHELLLIMGQTDYTPVILAMFAAMVAFSVVLAWAMLGWRYGLLTLVGWPATIGAVLFLAWITK